MPSNPATAAAPPLVTVPVLSVRERRVLGVLVEKQKTTPDAYPMSLNALVTGSNQKSNREPLLDLTDLDVEEALATCQKQDLAIKITGSRVDRWRHALYDVWKVNKVELAVLAELMLRGPQTEGELRARVSRMEPVEDLEALRQILHSLAERKFVVYLTPEGRRGTTVTHGFDSPQDLERLRGKHAHAADGPDDSPREPRPVARPQRAEASTDQLDEIKSELAALQRQVADLTDRVRELETR